MNLSDLRKLVELEERDELNRKEVFDYGDVMQKSLQAVKTILKDHVNVPDIDRVHCVRGVPFGEEWSKKFDIAFEAGGFQIVYPDPNQFSETLLEYCKEIQPQKRKNRVFLDFYLRCWRATAHEIIHCVQGIMGQKDLDPLSWSAEHDASYLSGSLLAVALIQIDPEFWRVYKGLWTEEIKERMQEMQDEKVEFEYQKWKNSFGLESPEQFIVDIETASFLFKDRLAYEAMTEDMQEFMNQFKTCFDDGKRTGDVRKYPLIRYDSKIYNNLRQ